jgi:hypothetical protein
VRSQIAPENASEKVADVKSRFRLFCPGESYIWVMFIFWGITLSLAWFADKPNLATWTFPAFIGVIVICELQSGVALDSWARAKHERGGRYYGTMIAWHLFALVIFLIIARTQ